MEIPEDFADELANSGIDVDENLQTETITTLLAYHEKAKTGVGRDEQQKLEMRKKKKQAQEKLLQQKQQQQQKAAAGTAGRGTQTARGGSTAAQPPRRPPARPTEGPAGLLLAKRATTDSEGSDARDEERRESSTRDESSTTEDSLTGEISPGTPSARGRYPTRGGVKKVTPGTSAANSRSNSTSRPVPGRGAASFSRQNYAPGSKPMSRTNYTPRGSLQPDDDPGPRGSYQTDDDYNYNYEPEPVTPPQVRPVARPGASAAAATGGGGASARPGPKMPAHQSAATKAPTMRIVVPTPPPRETCGPPSMDELMRIISPQDPTVMYLDPVRIGSGYVAHPFISSPPSPLYPFALHLVLHLNPFVPSPLPLHPSTPSLHLFNLLHLCRLFRICCLLCLNV